MVVPTFAKKVLKKAINRFIWKNKNEKQTYDQKASKSLTDERLMAQEVGKGGLKSLHLESEINAFAAKWYIQEMSTVFPHLSTTMGTMAPRVPLCCLGSLGHPVGVLWQPLWPQFNICCPIIQLIAGHSRAPLACCGLYLR